MPQSVKGDLVVDLSRTTTPETVECSESNINSLVSGVDGDWVLHQTVAVNGPLIPAVAYLLERTSLALADLHQIIPPAAISSERTSPLNPKKNDLPNLCITAFGQEGVMRRMLRSSACN